MKTQTIELADSKERERALDPTQSFIVQAPAGSGKTELLTQRFLKLLSCVKQPEEILAITFTKKSAAEMRARIIKALKNAENPEPEADHARQTWLLAKHALQSNTHYQWNLLENPNRLQIQTIDSFNGGLTRFLPMESKFGSSMEIMDDAAALYREAAQTFLSHIEDNFAWGSAIEKLLLHLDNDLTNVENLLINLLAKRDQWLPYISSNSNNPELRKTLEKHLTYVNTDTLTQLCELFPKEHEAELITLIRFAAQNVLRENPSSKITLCADLTALPGNKIEDKNLWKGISALLLTDDDTWRKSINKKQGFPSPTDTKKPEEKSLLNSLKLRMLDLIENLSSHEELRQQFEELNLLPESQYQNAHWETLKALHQILWVVVAQLKIIFQEHGKIDYIENAQAAYHSLGTDELPTDLTLALDYKIQHVLIDEFQDTSNSQYRLLEKIIAGWQPHENRTLFVVGDPMQSIYRFREAEVGLFIRARKKGIGQLKLQPLTLSVNFRSVPGIVNWVNDTFAKVFPCFDDIGSGAVSFMPSTTCQKTEEHIAVKYHPFLNAKEIHQAQAIIRLIEEIKQNQPEKKIAILVRSRTHLTSLIPLLKKANLPFRALEIDPLTTRPVIQDLLSLTRALLQPADRIAWLAILRAPWCGLTLSDLLVIAGDKSKSIIMKQLESAEIRSLLNVQSQSRLARIVPILKIALQERRRYSLRQWIEYTWLQLGGPACVHQPSDLEDAKAFFNLLDKLNIANDLLHFSSLNEAIKKLYAAPNTLADDRLQIMTVHNAKGLEFDVVILPHLERKTSQDEKQLLQWIERPRGDESTHLILAPIHAVGETSNSIYDYIKHQQTIKTDYEMGRLLYVAATRAKEQLHIFFNLEAKDNSTDEIKSPSNNSLLKKLWPAIQHDIKNAVQTIPSTAENELKTETTKQINRLQLLWQNPIHADLFSDSIAYHQKKLGFYLPQNDPKYIGIAIHKILQMISEHGVNWWNSQSQPTQIKYIKKHLRQLGMSINAIANSTDIVKKAIGNTLHDARGKWILASQIESNSEWPLTVSSKNLVIDRTFVDKDGIRWIIDYKTTDYTGDDLNNFLEMEKKLYETQLSEYAQALAEIDSRPIRLGLYFPLIPAWKEWN